MHRIEADAAAAGVTRLQLTATLSGAAFYRVDIRIAPGELKKLKKGAKMTPGMPAMAQFVTGKRSVMDFLISPITSTLEDAFREE